MKKRVVVIMAIASLAGFSTVSEAYVGQQHVFTRGGLNTNNCTSQGRNCHPPIYKAPMSPQAVATQPNPLPTNVLPPAASTPLAPTGPVSSVISGLKSLF